MSKKKPRPSRKPVPAVETTANEKKGFGKSFAQMMFIVAGALGIFYSIFLALTPKKGDTINDYILENMPRLLTWEWILFSAIAVAFLYFAFKWVFKSERKLYDYAVLLIAFLAINGLFALSFDKDLGSFGDNAQYIVHSKSLLEKGGPYDIYFPNEAYNGGAAIGLPMMLAPVTAAFGMDVVKMKVLVFLLGGLSLVFFFLAFRKLCGPYLAALLMILTGSFPLFVFNTSYIMTEVPFVFTISVSLFCALKLGESKQRKQVILWSLLTILAASMVYLTRAVGAAIMAGTIAWLFFRIPWIGIFRKEQKLFSLPTVKFAVVTGALVVMFLGWQLQTGAAVKRDQAARGVQQEEVEASEDTSGKQENSQEKTSQLALFLSSDFMEQFNTNFKLVKPLWGQQIFNKDLSRWYFSLGKAARTKDINAGLRFFNILLLISLLAGLIRRDIMAFVLIFLTVATLAGTATPVLMVYSRYFIPFVPFIIYLMARMLPDLFEFLAKKRPMPAAAGFAAFASSILLFVILYHNFSGNAFNAQRQNSGNAYSVAFDSYLQAGKWVRENLEEDVLIASRKPRLFYVFSERKGVYTVTYSNMVYSEEVARERIEYFREKEVDYVILDAFSTASRNVILPLIQNYPDNFRVLNSVGDQYPSYVVEFTP
jgi:hypothetical protein